MENNNIIPSKEYFLELAGYFTLKPGMKKEDRYRYTVACLLRYDIREAEIFMKSKNKQRYVIEAPLAMLPKSYDLADMIYKATLANTSPSDEFARGNIGALLYLEKDDQSVRDIVYKAVIEMAERIVEREDYNPKIILSLKDIACERCPNKTSISLAN